nr:hypothetical protein [Vibrio parahaemolyticus]
MDVPTSLFLPLDQISTATIRVTEANSRLLNISKLTSLEKRYNALLRCEQRNTEASAYHLNH